MTAAPVDLLNTANDRFPISTYCVAPTAPLLSDGAPGTVNVPPGPLNPVPTPSKLSPAVTEINGVMLDCGCSALSVTAAGCCAAAVCAGMAFTGTFRIGFCA